MFLLSFMLGGYPTASIRNSGRGKLKNRLVLGTRSVNTLFINRALTDIVVRVALVINMLVARIITYLACALCRALATLDVLVQRLCRIISCA